MIAFFIEKIFSSPVVALDLDYLTYNLMRADIGVVLMDDIGALHKNQLKRVTSQGLLLAVSYHPHADETTESINTASERQNPILVLTDHSFILVKTALPMHLKSKNLK